ncbi:xanthine dehydrogenase family protein subunit M [Marivibrio halodurans]|uniref:Xanthine dehydrogenase family protein subunit M n=1 Tax=Marivibrio halodurans TaxID=2039722 RepID=A0A8J7S4B7_9PROT|nr:xanthine dehydrogenase family protein subunit M [Marivibrio halodurans]MBP5858313.1 xanthine dehydrogenase family protein subunit M [Marivibrio halodurans]
MTATSYLRPRDLTAALDALAGAPMTVLSGGTDHFPARVGPRPPEAVLDIGGIDALRGIEETVAGHRLGARTTWMDVIEADLPPHFDALKQAAREVGGMQIQNRGTLGGNLCNASPAADGTPCLLAADAMVVLASARGERRLPLADFQAGYRATARRPDELLTAIEVPKPAVGSARSCFLKLGARHYLVISIAMVAATLEVTPDGTVAAARIAVGACSATARRLPALEAALAGRPVAPGLGGVVVPDYLDDLSPIDDVRASADYRRHAAGVLIARALECLATAGKGA